MPLQLIAECDGRGVCVQVGTADVGHAVQRESILFSVDFPHVARLCLAPAKEDIALRVVTAGLHLFRATLYFRVGHTAV